MMVKYFKDKPMLKVFAPLILLLVPFMGNIFSKEINWSLSDFFIGALLIMLMSGSVLALSKIRKLKVRILTIIAVSFFFVVLWAEMAVGIFGSPIAGN